MTGILSAMLLTTSLSADDVIFVQTDTAGVYRGEHGVIVSLTSTHVVLRSGEQERLFARDAVHRIALSGSVRDEDRTHWRETLNTYWNADKSPLVKAVQALPIVGQPLRALDNIPTTVASLLASIALCIALVWAAYKAYELTIVSSETRRLARLRLQIEIAKLRNEALETSQRLQLSDVTKLAAIIVPLPEAPSGRDPSDGMAAFRNRKHSKLLRVFMSLSEREDQRELYQAEAALAYRRGTSHARWSRRRRAFWLALGEVICGLYGALSVFGSIGFLLPAPGSTGPESLSTAGAMLGLGLFLVRQAVRLGLKLRDIRNAYAKAQPHSEGFDEILGTA